VSRSFDPANGQKQENGTMELMNFDFNSNDIRVVEIDGEPWFPAKDVCDVLGLSQPSNFTSRLRNTEVTNVLKSEVSNPYSTGISFPNRGLTFVSESAVYKLVMLSRKPEAEAFQDWVAGTVLPSIRKDGGYIAGEEKVATGEMSEDELVLKAMTMLKTKAERLQKHVSDHLEYMTVDEFFALKHIYPTPGDRTAMGHRASRICRETGEHKRFQRRYAPKVERVVELGEYPVAVLEEAYGSMVMDGRIPRNLPQMDLGLVH
jgi:prophage antirepressor-like protein